MKDLFRGYYQLEKEEFEPLWKSAIFIFDTNVLLNLYRYQSSTSTSLLEVIQKLSNRVWIPYHTGLEFQRNRLTVIADQHNFFSKVKEIVNETTREMETKLNNLHLEKRHSHINPNKLIEDIKKVITSNLETLEQLEKESISTSSNDIIRKKIDLLFENKIGKPPKTQDELNSLYEEGEERYKNNIPPGFEDVTKDSKETQCFTYAGMLYKRKYGDFIIWKQIIQYAKEKEIKDIIYITDDKKSDWWLIVKGKTIGVRPELIEEICREAGVDKFHMYSTETFLRYANENLNANITKATIDEVREVISARNNFSLDSIFLHQDRNELAEKAVYNWLRHEFENIERRNGFLDFIAYKGELKFGFKVQKVRGTHSTIHMIEDYIYQSNHAKKEGFFEIIIALIMPDVESFEHTKHKLIHKIKHMLEKYSLGGRIHILIGSIEFNTSDENPAPIFLPYKDIVLSEKL